MRSSVRADERQLNLLDVPALPSASKLRATKTRDRVYVDLRGFGSQLRERAALRGIAPAVLLRKAALALLYEEQSQPEDELAAMKLACLRRGAKVKVTLRLSGAHAVRLASQARSAGVSQGDYVCGLLDGAVPALLPPDHGESIRALLTSADRLAALSVDLNAFSRLVGRVQAPQLEPYRASLNALTADVRKHLALSAALIAELKPARKTSR